jgi:predicted TIM-barrel fold metal-dependent hydrolase
MASDTVTGCASHSEAQSPQNASPTSLGSSDSGGLDRRQALFLGLAAATCPAPAAAHAKPSRGFIDVHHHFTPPGRRGAYVSPVKPWSPQGSLEEMDRNGVATGIGYLGFVDDADVGEGRHMARSWNEFGAGLQRQWPQRFGLFAALPMLDVDGSLQEMAYALDVLKADGLGLATNYGNLWLGDAHFDPIWQEANRRKAVIFVHPRDAPCCGPDQLSYMNSTVMGPWLEWPVNTARTILSLMMSGTLRKYRDIRFIFSHGGGVMPLILGRVGDAASWPAVGPEKFNALFPEGMQAEFARLHFECALAYNEVNFAALSKLAPPTQLLFGTDFDRISIQYSVEHFGRLRLAPTTAARISRGNAEALFPRLRG